MRFANGYRQISGDESFMMAKILIVDDSNFSRRVLRNILESAGHVVLDAADGFSGIECFTMETPDLTMLDVTMAGMTGLELLEKVRQISPEARVVVASADVQSSTRKMAADQGAVGFINKPFVEADVVHRVNLVLHGDSAW